MPSPAFCRAFLLIYSGAARGPPHQLQRRWLSFQQASDPSLFIPQVKKEPALIVPGTSTRLASSAAGPQVGALVLRDAVAGHADARLHLHGRPKPAF